MAKRPELHQQYRGFLEAVNHNQHVPARLLDLCRARIELIHGLPVSVSMDAETVKAITQGDMTSFTSAEQAALVVAERMPYQHHELADEEVATVREALGDAGCVVLLTALAFHDVNCRLRLTFGDTETA